ncbi:MAG TPA: glycosyltransferase family 4 protein [Polyangiaceae bacterium LLY-WYZ-15_(1-7)]|nr:glycosyl transferase [Myxococcales bacterium]MAT26556.1 glycosyl transferase [Sandaracinus sp.]HJL02460.1 glycosyltransferase family 4 protein [Polyangiaceae bacterium LLY-WYZ-15_(1-7)]MBJ74520.1 glycosyl transferase [Sandaracinus sp.]HJL12243.1 glycosyltransferase family 4 protein [Polyangiaceae bacterium LLY-WYZ-15_(1-7)]
MRIHVSYEKTLPRSDADAEVVVHTAAALARRGHALTLVAPGQPGRPPLSTEDLLAHQGARAPLERFGFLEASAHLGDGPGGLFLPLRMGAQAHRVVRDPRARAADVFYARNPLTLALALRAGHRVLFDHYRPWADQVPPLQPFLRAALLHPRCLGAVLHSEVARQSYARLGVPADQLRVVHNGWAPSRLEPRLSRADARARVGLPVDRPVAVYAGRVNAAKGLDVVLAMARHLPQVLFVLVGSTGEGPIERAAANLENVRVVPWQAFADTAPYLHAADALIIPPSAAPLTQHGSTVLPLKLFLYLGAGKAILAPSGPDVRELLEHDRNALLVPPGDVPAALVALRALVGDRLLRERLGRRAREDAEALTWDGRAARIEAFLEERLATQAPAEWSPRRFLQESRRWVAQALARGRVVLPARLDVDVA